MDTHGYAAASVACLLETGFQVFFNVRKLLSNFVLFVRGI